MASDHFLALFVLFSATYFGDVATQGMNTTADNITTEEFNMTTSEVYNTTGFMNDTEFNTTTTELYTNTTELYANTTELYPNTTELYANTTELNTTVSDFFTNTTTTEAFGVKGDNMFQDGEKNLMVALGIVIAINCVGVVVFIVWIVRKCLRDKARKTAARFYQYNNKGMADDISEDTSSKRKLSTIAESDHESVAGTLKSTSSKTPAERVTESEEQRDARVMELSRLSSLSTRVYGSESENV